MMTSITNVINTGTITEATCEFVACTVKYERLSVKYWAKSEELLFIYSVDSVESVCPAMLVNHIEERNIH